MPPPTVLLLAGSDPALMWPLRDEPSSDIDTQRDLRRLLHCLADLGCNRFVVCGAPALRSTVEVIAGELSTLVRFAGVKGEGGIVETMLAAEAALSHIAAGPVYVTRPHSRLQAPLHAAMLTRWGTRPSTVDGLVAAAPASTTFAGPRLEIDGERVISVLEDDARRDGGLSLLDAIVYASSRELCETVADEAQNRDAPRPFTSGLSRLMAWYEFRAVLYGGPRSPQP